MIISDWNLIFHALKESSADAGGQLWYVTVDMNGKYPLEGQAECRPHRNQGVCEPHSLLTIGFHWPETLISFPPCLKCQGLRQRLTGSRGLSGGISK